MTAPNRLQEIVDELGTTVERIANADATNPQTLTLELARAKAITDGANTILEAIRLRLDAAKLKVDAARYRVNARPPEVLNEDLR